MSLLCFLPRPPARSAQATPSSTAPLARSSAALSLPKPASAKIFAEFSPGSGAGLRLGPQAAFSPNSAGNCGWR